jgi:hypothetical protein
LLATGCYHIGFVFCLLCLGFRLHYLRNGGGWSLRKNLFLNVSGVDFDATDFLEPDKR